MKAVERNLIGMRFGKLVVVERAVKNDKGQRMWKCICDCGNEKLSRESMLLAGKLNSCGVNHRGLNLIGQRFTRLTVVAFHKRDVHHQFIWKCVCDCGNEVISSGNQLRRHKAKSCGCIKKDSNAKRKEYGEASFNNIIRQYKNNAAHRGYVFTLTPDEFRHLISQNCNYCGRPPSQQRNSKSYGNIIHNGIDRVDNNVGYIIENVVPCCVQCNISKTNHTVDEFKGWLKMAYEHMKLNEVMA